MSGELQPFELIYVPRGEQLRSFAVQSFQPSPSFFVTMWCIHAGVPVYLSKRAELVDEAGGHSVLGRPVLLQMPLALVRIGKRFGINMCTCTERSLSQLI